MKAKYVPAELERLGKTVARQVGDNTDVDVTTRSEGESLIIIVTPKSDPVETDLEAEKSAKGENESPSEQKRRLNAMS